MFSSIQELSEDPLRRRSLYLRFEHPSIERETRILEKRTAGTHMDLHGQLVGFAHALRGYHGGFVNLNSGSLAALRADSKVWKRMRRRSARAA